MPLASFFGWLNENQGSSTALLSAILVVVTIYYAIQNRTMAVEAQRARGAAILPKLALDLHRLGPTAVTVAVINVGPGAALDVDVKLSWEPLEGVTAPDPTRWRRNTLLPSDSADFMLGSDEMGDSLNKIPARYAAMRLKGSMKDAAGTIHEVNEEFADLAEWRKLLGGAHQRWVDPNPEKRLADALHSKFEGPLGNLNASAASAADAVQRFAPRENG
jgi:hypothetical protein